MIRRTSALIALFAVILAMVVAFASDAPSATGPPSALPTRTHWLGTTPQGVSLLPLLVIAAFRSLAYAALTTLVTCMVATVAGGISGMRAGGLFDRLTASATKFANTLSPLLLTACFVAAVPHAPVSYVVVVLGAMNTGSVNEVVRGAVVREISMPYFEAARAIGCTPSWLARFYLIPAIWRASLPQLIGLCGVNLGVLGSLSFLGIGVRREPTLGFLLFDAYASLTACPHYFAAVAIAFVLLVLLIANSSLAVRTRWLHD